MNLKSLARFSCGLAVALPLAVSSQPSIGSFSISGGGGTSGGGVVALTGTIGQPFAGVVNGWTSAINSGFWGSLATEPTPLPRELILNGSFENIAHTFVLGPSFPGPNGAMLLPPGSTTIPGWTVVTAALLWGNIDDNGAVLPTGAGTPFGHFYVDLTGLLDTVPYAGVTQTLSTSSNQTYQLSFALGTVENDYRWRGPVSLSVTAGSSSNLFTYTPTGTDWQWRTFTWTFTASSSSTPITLTGTSAAANFIALDNVSVSEAPALRITAFGLFDQELRFSFPANFGRSYVIESRAALEAGEWAAVLGATNTVNGSTIQVTVPRDLAQPQHFYRVKETP
jgi:hypothetical protein